MRCPQIIYYENEEIGYIEASIYPPRCSLCDSILNGDYVILLNESKLGSTGDNICHKCFRGLATTARNKDGA